MPLPVGTILGPYEILAPIGAGGMGEVYRAKDTKLKREVAIKVLPEAVARDPERMARFQREAELLASLNHPNIATIHGVEDRALVMELVEGNSPKGPLPFEEAWKIASQIATALEYAHDRGIMHRDLKPANIIVTPDGVVKLLDFGLAKAFSNQREPSASPENSPTLTLGATEVGVILGTAAYMAPEQARGKALDKRADIWSFGVVLYELLTGERLFTGEDAAETLAAVIHKQPDFAKAPREARRLLEECLRKDPKQRLRDIGDAKRLLGGVPHEQLPSAVRHRSWLPWCIAAFILLALMPANIIHLREQPVDHPLVRLDVDLGQDVSLQTPTGTSNVIISPDGTRLVYLASVAGGPPKLYIRRFDQPKATELPGTDGANAPFFSPDGQWVGFAVGTKLNKVSVEGGAAVPLGGDAGVSPGSSWGEDGNIVHAPLLKGLSRIPSGGGSVVSIAGLASGELTFAAPQVLPGGKDVLFFVYPTTVDPDNARIEVLTLADHRRKTVVQGGVSARYLATSSTSGYLVYANRATLFAVPFDLEHLEKRGTAVPVLDDVAFNPSSFESQFDVSRTGTLVYRKGSGSTSGLSMIQWVDAGGKKTPLVSKPGGYSGGNSAAQLSPDGKRLVTTVLSGGNEDIRVYDLSRETWTDLTFGGGHFYFSPAWSPDGQFVVFGSLTGMLWARADGASQPQQLTQKQSFENPSSIAPDGKRLAFDEASTGNSGQIWTVPLENAGGQLRAGMPEQFLKSTFSDVRPTFSPDGKWLAYMSFSSATPEVYVRAFPDNGGLWKISNSGGQNPIWSRNGHDLLYQAGDQEMTVSYSGNGSAFVLGKPRVWLDKVGGIVNDISLDGKRLVVLTPVESPGAPKTEHEVVLIQNFFDELRRKVPIGK
jgi:serine/threonine-protein kinase